MYKDFITQIQKPSYSAVESMHQTLDRLPIRNCNMYSTVGIGLDIWVFLSTYLPQTGSVTTCDFSAETVLFFSNQTLLWKIIYIFSTDRSIEIVPRGGPPL